MEFKLRGEEDRAASTYFSSSGSSEGYFTEQALRAGYITSDLVKSDFVKNNPMNVRAAIQRELEKERIRDEIIAAERRALEMEVRRELLLERELALQRRAHSHGLSLMGSSLSVLRADQRLSLMPHSEGSSMIDESLGFPTRTEVGMHQPEGARLEERLSLPPPEVGASLEKVPLQKSPEPKVADVKPLSEVGKGQVLFFAKPTISCLAGVKRKVVEPPPAIAGFGVLSSVGSKKKPQEWSCALCQVTATSEKGLNDHLQGKKHKSKEATLVASKTISKNTGGSTSSIKKTDKLTKTADTTDGLKPKQGKKQKSNNKQPVKQDGDSPVEKKLKMEDLKNKIGEALEQKKYKFWCEMCKVGTHSQKVMNCHFKGKKHVFRLEKKLKKENESAPGTISSSESTHENPKNMDMEAKEANEEMGNVDGEIDGVEEVADNPEAGEATVEESAVGMVDRSIVEESTEAQKDDSVPSSVAVVEGNEN